MRGGRVFLRVLSLIAVLAASVALPTAVDARPRLFGVLRAFMGGVAGLGVGHQYYRHHRHAIAARHDAPPPEAGRHDVSRPEAAAPPNADAARPSADNERPPPAGAEKSAGLQLPPPPTSLSSLPEADFATIEDQFFGYIFAPASYDTKFWAHGERDMIQAVFTKGSTSPPPNCGQSTQDRADPLIQHIEQATSPNEDQQEGLEALRSALVKAYDRINTTCRDVDPITPTARLKAMQERLFAVRDAGLSIRTSLAGFYDKLSDEQRVRFDSADTASAAEAKPSGGPDAGQICQAQAQAAYAWPSALVGRRVRPNPAQRASLEALQKTLFGMAMYLRGACPNEATSKPVARLDAAMRRLDGMIYAVIAIAPALDDFYGQLSDEQKARFNSINRAST
jgi:LTXXQ motif family protein